MAASGSGYGGLHTQRAAFRGDLSRTSSAEDDIPLMVRGAAKGSSHGGTFDMDDDMLLTDMSSGAKGPSRKQYHSAAYDFLCNGGWHRLWIRFWDGIRKCCFPKKEFCPRTLLIGRGQGKNSGNYIYPPNVIRNQKYSIISFVPMVLYEQFKVFLNLYFLVMALSQFIPSIRIGFLYTYWGPLAFVIFVTMCREAIDDIRRYRRDKEVNEKVYEKLTSQGLVPILSSEIQVGDLIVVNKDERVPADVVLLRTTEKAGSCFLRTDQLDGETDWKLRIAVPSTQSLATNADLFGISAHLYAEKPQNSIHSFVGTFCMSDAGKAEESLSIENTLWSNTVLASGTALGVVIYSGQETRSVMNTSHPHSKIGLLDTEVNRLTKVLFGSVMILSIVMVSLKGFQGPWYIYLFRFILLFSYIIPISLRVNLDMGKLVYSWKIQRDQDIPGTVVRSTTLPEELGRISYVFSDKTGTLTQNEMVFKRLHLGSSYYSPESMDEVQMHLCTAFSGRPKKVTKIRSTVVDQVSSAVLAIALCHNVTPVYEAAGDSLETEADQATSGRRSYQASSPDEVALVTWTESVGLALVSRDVSSMQLRGPSGQMLTYRILEVFPFTSDSKRMGIIVQEESSGNIVFYMKGADTVMVPIVQYNDWLEEEVGNMAREGLRTLVVSRKTLTEEQYKEFQSRYQQAKLTVHERSLNVSSIVASLERDMELLCLTGVEDRLQEHVRPTLETLRNAAIKVWMLTGDKLETAICIAQSSRLVSKTQNLHLFQSVTNRADAHRELNAFRRKIDSAFIITGDSLEICLKFYDEEFAELACQCPAVIVCRCSPTQKAEIVKLIKNHTRKTTLAIGDGGNDVSMIQSADVGVGIVGKEGKQASLAGDFSVNQFSYLARLLLVHGRDSYKRSASLSQFVIHRGLIISVMQAVFSSVFYFASVSLFPGLLMVGYATVFTMFPVFSLVLDKDVSAEIAMTFPELYKDLTKGRSLSFKTFFLWVLISIYQGGIIMYGALLLFDQDFIHVLSITYTALILTELFMVALTIRTWHWSMILAQVASLAIYIAALVLLKSYFDAQFLKTWSFVWKVIAITSISCIPLYIIKVLRKKFSPPSYSKLNP